MKKKLEKIRKAKHWLKLKKILAVLSYELELEPLQSSNREQAGEICSLYGYPCRFPQYIRHLSCLNCGGKLARSEIKQKVAGECSDCSQRDLSSFRMVCKSGKAKWSIGKPTPSASDPYKPS
jgi:hypothetical protein